MLSTAHHTTAVCFRDMLLLLIRNNWQSDVTQRDNLCFVRLSTAVAEMHVEREPAKCITSDPWDYRALPP